MATKTIMKSYLTFEISKDFFVEAFRTEDAFEYWLCRKNYGRKVFIFGDAIVNYSKDENLNTNFNRYINLFLNYDYMQYYCKELLECDEKLKAEKLNIDYGKSDKAIYNLYECKTIQFCYDVNGYTIIINEESDYVTYYIENDKGGLNFMFGIRKRNLTDDELVEFLIKAVEGEKKL